MNKLVKFMRKTIRFNCIEWKKISNIENIGRDFGVENLERSILENNFLLFNEQYRLMMEDDDFQENFENLQSFLKKDKNNYINFIELMEKRPSFGDNEHRRFHEQILNHLLP